jgi:CheY-like chemotaxis protein
MSKATILFVDNDLDFLETRSEFLREEGYRVIPAKDPESARRWLEKGGIDLAIIDIRLEDDDDERDTSGLTLAKEAPRSMPKVILTSWPSVDAVREVLRPQWDGLPAAVDFVDKEDGPDALSHAVYLALGPGTSWLRQVEHAIKGTDKELGEDHDSTQRQSRVNFVVSLIVTVFGILIVFVGIGLVFSGKMAIGIASTAAGIVTEAVSFLFFSRADKANDRMDRYHKERMQGQRFKTLLQACEGLDAEQEREHCREQVIMAATGKWLAGSATDGGLATVSKQEDHESSGDS